MTDPEPETTLMTSPDVLRAKAIAALIEAADLDDDDDAKTVIGLIKAVLASSAAKQP